jgi:hypothetical protein
MNACPTLNLTHSDSPTRVNGLFDADLVLCQATQFEREKRKHLGSELGKPSNIDTLYLDVIRV